MRPEAVEYAVQEFGQQLDSSLAGLGNKIGRLRQRSERIEQELEAANSNLIACNANPILVAAIKRRQQELDDITRQLLSSKPDSVSAEIGRIREFVTGQLGDTGNFFRSMSKKPRRNYVSGVRMVPQSDGKRGTPSQKGNGTSCAGTVNEQAAQGFQITSSRP